MAGIVSSTYRSVVGVEGGRVEDLADDLKLLDKFELWDQELE